MLPDRLGELLPAEWKCDSVHGIEVGQRLVGGGFGQLRNLPANHVYKIPESPLFGTIGRTARFDPRRVSNATI